MKRVAVLGAGVTGLTAARSLQAAGHAPVIFEAGARIGGYMASDNVDGWRFEQGPNTLAADVKTVDTLTALGVADRLVEASSASSKRFLVKDGKPVALAMGPGIFASPLFSAGAKLAIVKEPFRTKRDPAQGDESVADFVRRRLGDEWLARAVGPFISGVYAGDPERLSLRWALPRMFELEQTYGSLIKAAAKLGSVGAKKLYSTATGLGGLADGLAAGLADVRLNTAVTAVRPAGAGWLVATAGGEEPFDAVIATLGPRATAELFAGLVPELAAALRKVAMPPVWVVHHGYRRAALEHAVDGFGMLIPRVENLLTLGTLFPSSMFAGRAPEGHVLLSSFLGGRLHENLGNLPAGEIERKVLDEHRALLGIHEPPVFLKSILWKNAITQYEIGHGKLQELWSAAEAQHANLFLRGNFTGGVALGDRIAAGAAAAKQAAGA
jgi:oxygen-dependent protoporphyrinogen oxidase